jgi:hypothetical protein
MKISQIFRLKSSYIQTQTRILSMWVLGKKTNDTDVYAIDQVERRIGLKRHKVIATCNAMVIVLIFLEEYIY